ncbi:hypothetical protein [Roseiconus lacunae]|uniref:hypothetical protein n=1 Tax=Roseiconus lacunae TaxID=2605694 RepID=UPI0011F404A4|nr:hypothetical protein [Roseiconus lacunae]MCD0457843.1 hypothetical protein [Roseiconus lacunae]
MHRVLPLIVFPLLCGCTDSRTSVDSVAVPVSSVQLFNESILGATLSDPLPTLLPRAKATWFPRQVILDYKDNACYGAMIHYDRTQPFELLRGAINLRFGEFEFKDFADDPTMGLWRSEEQGFAIQLSDDEDDESFRVTYLRFVEPATIADTLEDLRESEPELFQGIPADDMIDAFREMDSVDSQMPEGG